jgi:hypothetical protein
MNLIHQGSSEVQIRDAGVCGHRAAATGGAVVEASAAVGRSSSPAKIEHCAAARFSEAVLHNLRHMYRHGGRKESARLAKTVAES